MEIIHLTLPKYVEIIYERVLDIEERQKCDVSHSKKYLVRYN